MCVAKVGERSLTASIYLDLGLKTIDKNEVKCPSYFGTDREDREEIQILLHILVFKCLASIMGWLAWNNLNSLSLKIGVPRQSYLFVEVKGYTECPEVALGSW